MNQVRAKISLKHRTIINVLKLIGGRKILAKQFQKGKGLTAAPNQKLQKKYSITRSEFRGEPVWTYAGHDTLIYFAHGGGYVAGFAPLHFPMMGEVARQSGATLVAVSYTHLTLPTKA